MPVEAAALSEILRTARRIAVVGLSPSPHRPSHEVAVYLQSAGYRIVPVRPGVREILGERAYPDLRSAAEAGPIDIVDIFRRSDKVLDTVDDCLAIRPKLVVMQVGVVNQVAADRLARSGIPVIMDRCLMADHSNLLGA